MIDYLFEINNPWLIIYLKIITKEMKTKLQSRLKSTKRMKTISQRCMRKWDGPFFSKLYPEFIS